MVPITQVPSLLRDSIVDWRNVRAADLLFSHRDAAVIAVVLLIGLPIALMVARAMTRRRAGRTQVALPAVLDWSGGSWTSIVRHGALLLFLAGLPFFAMALADPYSALTREETSFPGRRIALMIDASSSMMARFPAAHLNAKAPNEATFFTTVAAAETFIRQRMTGKYHDLIGLVEFGDEAYVVTPFTNDYDNILLSLSLIGDWTEFMKFPDQGTTIGLAIEQSVKLFRAFDFLDAAGNLMLIFSDGQDTQVMIHGKSVSEILAGAVATKIPVYFIRTSYNKGLGARAAGRHLEAGRRSHRRQVLPGGRRADDSQRDQGHRSAVGRARGREALQQPAAALHAVRVHGDGALDDRPGAAVDGALFPEVSVVRRSSA